MLNGLHRNMPVFLEDNFLILEHQVSFGFAPYPSNVLIYKNRPLGSPPLTARLSCQWSVVQQRDSSPAMMHWAVTLGQHSGQWPCLAPLVWFHRLQQDSQHNRPVISWIENILFTCWIYYRKHDYIILCHICRNETVQVVEIHPQEMQGPGFLHGQ